MSPKNSRAIDLYFSNLKMYECFLCRSYENGFYAYGHLIPRISSICEVFRVSHICQEMHRDVSVIFASNSAQMHGTDMCSFLGWSSCLSSLSLLYPPRTPFPRITTVASVLLFLTHICYCLVPCAAGLNSKMSPKFDLLFFFPPKPTKKLSLLFTSGQSVQTILKQHRQKYFLKTHIRLRQNPSSNSSDSTATHEIIT